MVPISHKVFLSDDQQYVQYGQGYFAAQPSKSHIKFITLRSEVNTFSGLDKSKTGSSFRILCKLSLVSGAFVTATTRHPLTLYLYCNPCVSCKTTLRYHFPWSNPQRYIYDGFERESSARFINDSILLNIRPLFPSWYVTTGFIITTGYPVL